MVNGSVSARTDVGGLPSKERIGMDRRGKGGTGINVRTSSMDDPPWYELL